MDLYLPKVTHVGALIYWTPIFGSIVLQFADAFPQFVTETKSTRLGIEDSGTAYHFAREGKIYRVFVDQLDIATNNSIIDFLTSRGGNIERGITMVKMSEWDKF